MNSPITGEAGRTALVNAHVLHQRHIVEDHAVVLDGARIAAVVPERELPRDIARLDLQGGTLLPGFIDTQVNGGGGVLFNETPTVEGLRVIAAAHRRFGTTGMLPTVISDDLSVVASAMRAVEDAIAQGVPGILGIHIEGPFISETRRGIHAKQHLARLDDEAMALLTSLRHGRTLVTIAPECVEEAQIRQLHAAGTIVAAGHSNASYEQVRAALAAGVTGFTHLFNAMSSLTSRAPGMTGAALEDREAWCGLIVDGRHVHPATLRIALAARPLDRFMLVTDAMPPVGTDARSFSLQGRTITTDGAACLDAEGTLSGSVLDMATALHNAVTLLGTSLAGASLMASEAPASFLRQGDLRGRIAPGLAADLVLIDGDGKVQRSWIAGVEA